MGRKQHAQIRNMGPIEKAESMKAQTNDSGKGSKEAQTRYALQAGAQGDPQASGQGSIASTN